jgi:hypothetical protein
MNSPPIDAGTLSPLPISVVARSMPSAYPGLFDNALYPFLCRLPHRLRGCPGQLPFLPSPTTITAFGCVPQPIFRQNTVHESDGADNHGVVARAKVCSTSDARFNTASTGEPRRPIVADGAARNERQIAADDGIRRAGAARRRASSHASRAGRLRWRVADCFCPEATRSTAWPRAFLHLPLYVA